VSDFQDAVADAVDAVIPAVEAIGAAIIVSGWWLRGPLRRIRVRIRPVPYEHVRLTLGRFLGLG
jgi:hypothetical protein